MHSKNNGLLYGRPINDACLSYKFELQTSYDRLRI